MNRPLLDRLFLGGIGLAILVAGAISYDGFRQSSQQVWVGADQEAAPSVTGSSNSVHKKIAPTESPEPTLKLPNIPQYAHADKKTILDLEPTSWEDPFQPDYWQSDGWIFYDHSISSLPQGTALATFRKPYSQLMLEFQIEPIETGGEFQVLLAETDTNSVTVIDLGRTGIVIAEASGDIQTEIERRMIDLQLFPDQPAHFRMAATGNRISLSWNGQRVLNCNQPTSTAGSKFRFTIATANNALKLSKMRIEGE